MACLCAGQKTFAAMAWDDGCILCGFLGACALQAGQEPSLLEGSINSFSRKYSDTPFALLLSSNLLLLVGLAAPVFPMKC